MKTTGRACALSLLALLCVCAKCTTPWPQPASHKVSTQPPLRVDPAAFRFRAICARSPLLDRALDRYTALAFETPAYTLHTPAQQAAFYHQHQHAASLPSLTVCVHSQSQELSSATSERYDLHINEHGANLTAHTVFGALRGLETFAQLLTVVSTDRLSTDSLVADSGDLRVAQAYVSHIVTHSPAAPPKVSPASDVQAAAAQGTAALRVRASEDSRPEPAVPAGSLMPQELSSVARRWSNRPLRNSNRPLRTSIAEVERATGVSKVQMQQTSASNRSGRDSVKPALPAVLYLIGQTSIVDEPRFSHRGLMIDTSRHFLPMRTIAQLVDSMAWNKLNVLHWHLTDDPAFPYSSTVLPEMIAGAYHLRLTYSAQDITDLVVYARDRGVRVYVEMDTPGHTASFAAGLPHLLTQCYDSLSRPHTLDPARDSSYISTLGDSLSRPRTLDPAKDSTSISTLGVSTINALDTSTISALGTSTSRVRRLQTNDQQPEPTAAVSGISEGQNGDVIWGSLGTRLGPVNPVREEGYVHLDALYSELAGLFPDELLHIGGDEVQVDCWQSNPEVRAFAERRGWSGDFSQLQCYFTNHLVRHISHLNRTLVVWQEVFDTGTQMDINSTIVQVWINRLPGSAAAPQASTCAPAACTAYLQEVAAVVQAGYRALLSAPWYLDHYAARPGLIQWHELFKVDPRGFKGSAAEKARVLGGEAALWGEFIDATNLVQRTWPRAAAVAERLWSPMPVALLVNSPCHAGSAASQAGTGAKMAFHSPGGKLDCKGGLSCEEGVWSEVIEEATVRLREHRCRMLARGTRVEPGVGFGSARAEFVPDDCHPDALAAAGVI